MGNNDSCTSNLPQRTCCDNDKQKQIKIMQVILCDNEKKPFVYSKIMNQSQNCNCNPKPKFKSKPRQDEIIFLPQDDKKANENIIMNKNKEKFEVVLENKNENENENENGKIKPTNYGEIENEGSKIYKFSLKGYKSKSGIKNLSKNDDSDAANKTEDISYNSCNPMLAINGNDKNNNKFDKCEIERIDKKIIDDIQIDGEEDEEGEIDTKLFSIEIKKSINKSNTNNLNLNLNPNPNSNPNLNPNFNFNSNSNTNFNLNSNSNSNPKVNINIKQRSAAPSSQIKKIKILSLRKKETSTKTYSRQSPRNKILTKNKSLTSLELKPLFNPITDKYKKLNLQAGTFMKSLSESKLNLKQRNNSIPTNYLTTIKEDSRQNQINSCSNIKDFDSSNDCNTQNLNMNLKEFCRKKPSILIAKTVKVNLIETPKKEGKSITKNNKIINCFENQILLEGELMKLIDEHSHSYISRYCQINKNEFLIFKNKHNALLFRHQPIIRIPIPLISNILKYSSNSSIIKSNFTNNSSLAFIPFKSSQISILRNNDNIFLFEITLKDKSIQSNIGVDQFPNNNMNNKTIRNNKNNSTILKTVNENDIQKKSNFVSKIPKINCNLLINDNKIKNKNKKNSLDLNKNIIINSENNLSQGSRNVDFLNNPHLYYSNKSYENKRNSVFNGFQKLNNTQEAPIRRLNKKLNSFTLIMNENSKIQEFSKNKYITFLETSKKLLSFNKKLSDQRKNSIKIQNYYDQMSQGSKRGSISSKLILNSFDTKRDCPIRKSLKINGINQNTNKSYKISEVRSNLKYTFGLSSKAVRDNWFSLIFKLINSNK